MGCSGRAPIISDRLKLRGFERDELPVLLQALLLMPLMSLPIVSRISLAKANDPPAMAPSSRPLNGLPKSQWRKLTRDAYNGQ